MFTRRHGRTAEGQACEAQRPGDRNTRRAATLVIASLITAGCTTQAEKESKERWEQWEREQAEFKARGYKVDLEHFERIAVENYKKILREEGLLDENLQPVKHKLVAGEDNKHIRIISPNQVTDEGAQPSSVISFAWKANRGGTEVFSQSQFPWTPHTNVQLTPEDNPDKTYRVTFSYAFDSFLDSKTSVNESCLKEVYRNTEGETVEEFNRIATEQCISAEKLELLIHYLGYVSSVNITVPRSEEPKIVSAAAGNR